MIKSREAIDCAIAYVRGDAAVSIKPAETGKSIKAGEGRAVAILTAVRDAGGIMGQRDFEDTCLRNCRTLVGAGGFIARGSITRDTSKDGSIQYKITDKGLDTVSKWETRYGKNWESALEHFETLGNPGIGDGQKIILPV